MQALSDCALHVLPAELLEALARDDAAVAWELARAISGRLQRSIGLIRVLAFRDLRARIGQQLVEIAFHQAEGTPLVASVTQQELADLVGSPRTSIARILSELRREGIVASVPRGIQLIRPERLAPSLRPTLVA